MTVVCSFLTLRLPPDLLYAETSFPSLVTTLSDLSAPHTIIFLAFKRRGETILKLRY